MYDKGMRALLKQGAGTPGSSTSSWPPSFGTRILIHTDWYTQAAARSLKLKLPQKSKHLHLKNKTDRSCVPPVALEAQLSHAQLVLVLTSITKQTGQACPPVALEAQLGHAQLVLILAQPTDQQRPVRVVVGHHLIRHPCRCRRAAGSKMRWGVIAWVLRGGALRQSIAAGERWEATEQHDSLGKVVKCRGHRTARQPREGG